MPDKPNILVIWGDDIGITNLYSDGLMGYRTPNIDRVANEGMRFTDAYGEQSCTAGRSAFITGQSVFRTGLSKVGLPAAPVGLRAEDPTIAELLKNHGYSTGQFGKNHLGDRNEFLPTVHGFDEFFGNLYHLNAEKDPEDPDHPEKHGFVVKLKKGHEAAGKTFRVRIDGYNLLPYLTGEEERSPRQGFIYFSDDGDLVALRFDNWKLVFMEQRAQGTLELWAEPFVPLRIPKLYNLRTDPFERADTTSNTCWDWYVSKAYMILAAQAIVAEFLATFEEYPPRQKAASFTIDQALEKMEEATSGARG
jgi:arylsulfatase A-like enzyme